VNLGPDCWKPPTSNHWFTKHFVLFVFFVVFRCCFGIGRNDSVAPLNDSVHGWPVLDPKLRRTQR